MILLSFVAVFFVPGNPPKRAVERPVRALAYLTIVTTTRHGWDDKNVTGSMVSAATLLLCTGRKPRTKSFRRLPHQVFRLQIQNLPPKRLKT